MNVALGNLLRDTMIANKKLDMEQKDHAAKALGKIDPSMSVNQGVRLMSEWINSEEALQHDDERTDEESETRLENAEESKLDALRKAYQ